MGSEMCIRDRFKAARKVFLIKFHLMRLFFAFFVSVNKKDKFSSFIKYIDNRIGRLAVLSAHL